MIELLSGSLCADTCPHEGAVVPFPEVSLLLQTLQTSEHEHAALEGRSRVAVPRSGTLGGLLGAS